MHRFALWLLAIVLLTADVQASVPDCTAALEKAAPGLKVHATVMALEMTDGKPTFPVWNYGDSGNAVDFWPASTIKIFAVIAALEELHSLELPLESTLIFEHLAKDGAWILDSARTVPELLSEVFRRSSNEDYTLLLRFVGLDRINADFLTPERGFAHSALMRGYVLDRPWVYVRTEPQRITVRVPDGRTKVVTHEWSGRSYSAERGATQLDPKTANCATTLDLANCIRRVVFHDLLPESERFRITPEMAAFVCRGANGFSGLDTTAPASGPRAWLAGKDLFPKAHFYHKAGRVDSEVLELAVIDDRPQSGKAWILCVEANSGSDEVGVKLCRAVLEELHRSLAK